MIIATDDADTCGDLDKNLAGRRDATLAGGTPRLEETTVLGKTYCDHERRSVDSTVALYAQSNIIFKCPHGFTHF